MPSICLYKETCDEYHMWDLKGVDIDFCGDRWIERLKWFLFGNSISVHRFCVEFGFLEDIYCVLIYSETHEPWNYWKQ